MVSRSNTSSLLLAEASRTSRRPDTVEALAAELTKWRSVAVIFWTTFAAAGVAVLAIFLMPQFSLWALVAILLALLAQAAIAWLHCSVAEVFPLAPVSLLNVRRAVSWLGLWLAATSLFVACCFAFSSGEGPGLGLLTPCKETRALDLSVRTVYCLHEPALVQYVAAGALAAVLVMQHWHKRRYILSFPALQQQRWFRVKASLAGMARAALSLAFWAVTAFYSAYFLWGSWSSAWVASLTSSILQRPVYVYPTLWSDEGGYFPFIGLFTLSSLLTALSWHYAAVLTQVTLTQMVSFDPEGAGNHRLLLAGLRKNDNAYIQHLAFLDLCSLAEIDKERRTLLFNDVGEDPALTAALQECRTVLDTFTIDLQAATIAEMESSEKKQSGLHRAVEKARRFLQRSKSPASIFDRRQLLEWAGLAMASLVAKSLTEDRYGLVQSNTSIPTSLNSLVSCLVTVKQHEQATEQHLSARTLDAVPSSSVAAAEALTTAVYRITSTFHRYLQEYQFPEVLVPSLQAFVSFQI